MTHELRLERLLEAPPEIVFDTFTDPDSQHDLYADGPDWVVESDCDLRLGGRWTITFGPPGREPARETNVFEQIDRPQRLVYRSTMALPDGSSVETKMQITFEPENSMTRMTIIQSGFPTAELRDEFTGGWASILDALRSVATAKAAG